MSGILRDYQSWLASPLASMGHTYPGVGNWLGSAPRATENETPLPPMREAVGKGGEQAALDAALGPNLGRLAIGPQSALGFGVGAVNSVINGVRSAAQSFDRLLSYRPGEEDPQAPVDAFNLASVVGTSTVGASVPRGALTAGPAVRGGWPAWPPSVRAERAATLRRMHGEGATDGAIAAELGIPGWTVARMRNRMELPANYSGGVRRPPADAVAQHETMLRRMHADGANDGAIAAELGIPRSQVARMRTRLELQPNDLGGARRPPAEALAEREATIRRLHADGASDAAIAGELGMHPGYISRTMREMGLPSNSRSRSGEPSQPAPQPRTSANPVENLMQQGLDHNQIASQLRLSPDAVLRQMGALRRDALMARGAPVPPGPDSVVAPEQGDRPPALDSTGLGTVLTERLTPEQQIERLRQLAPELVEQLQALHGLQRQHFPGSANEPSPLLYDLDPPGDAPPAVIEAAAALQQAIQARMRPNNGPEMMRLGGPLPSPAGQRRPEREDFADSLQDIPGYWGDQELFENNGRFDADIVGPMPDDAEASRIQSVDPYEMMNRAAARPLNAHGRFGVPERAPVDMTFGSWRTETRRDSRTR